MTDAMWFMVMTDDARRMTKVIRYHTTPKGLRDVEADEYDFDGAGKPLHELDMRFCFFRSYSVDLLKQTHGSWFYPSLVIEDRA